MPLQIARRSAVVSPGGLEKIAVGKVDRCAERADESTEKPAEYNSQHGDNNTGNEYRRYDGARGDFGRQCYQRIKSQEQVPGQGIRTGEGIDKEKTGAEKDEKDNLRR
jgi:hypothetical protein